MTGTAPEGPPPPEDLTARVFRALYDQFDLHFTGGTHIAVPKGSPASPPPRSARSRGRSAIANITFQPRPTRCTAPTSPDGPEPRR